ncbi:MAG: ligase-associated DNA damage response endonuclease PdeM [Luteimonas sp.]
MPVAARIALELAGEQVELLADRALFWPARRRLMIADLHLGKADTFRRAGIALPRGGTDHDLERLGALLAATGARSLWVLGDMLHGPLTDTHWRAGWDDWRAHHPDIEIAVLVGNHDRALVTAGLDIRLLGDRIDAPPFALRHTPSTHASLHVICGHVHPVVALPGIRRRWPVFWLRPGITVLPAFSRFTAGELVTVGAGGSLVACVDGGLVNLATGES